MVYNPPNNQDKLMDRQLKSPYVPPKDKLISEAEIRKNEAQGKLVMDEIKVSC